MEGEALNDENYSNENCLHSCGLYKMGLYTMCKNENFAN